MNKKLLFSLLITFTTFINLKAQITCGSNFYDSGGVGGQYSSGENISYLIQPDGAGLAVTLTFSAFDTEPGYDSLIIYDNNTASGTVLGRFSGNQVPSMTFVAENPSGCLTAFFKSDGATIADGWAASVSCIASPTCFRPTSLMISALTHRTAQVTWTANSGEIQWTIEYGPAGFIPGTGTTATVTSLPYLIEDLDENTSYEFYAKARCGGVNISSYSMVKAFTTNTNPNLPFICGNSFTDEGGAGSDYFNYSNDTVVICPTVAGQHVSLIFSSFSTEQDYDSLVIYNGNSTSAPILGTYSGVVNIGTLTSTSANGCLTAVFVSDESANGPGWSATISCATSGLEENNIQTTVYPNPVKDILTIETTETINKVNILSIEGKVVTSLKESSVINVSHLNGGIYFLETSFESGKTARTQFIKE